MSVPTVDLPDRAAWRDWLAANHSNLGSIWLVISKKGARQPGLSYADAVEEALCFGWIDSRPNKLDAAHYLLLVSPRQRGSVWSRLNKERIARLDSLGLLEEPGLAKIAAAKIDGSWFALDEVEALHLPTAIAEALDANPATRSHRYASLGSLRKRLLDCLTELFTSPKPEVQDDG